MYVDEVNAAGGVLGRRIELISRDTKSRPDEAVRVSRELLNRENVDFLVGTFTSGEGPAVSEIAKEAKKVFIAVAPKTDRLTAPDALHPYVFRASANTTTEGRAAAAIVARWPIKRLATIAPDFAYGRDATTSFVARMKQLRPDVEIVDQQWPKLNEADYTPFITAQMGKKPDAVFSVICCGNFDAFARQAGAQGYFKAIGNRFIGLGEAGSIESLRALGAEYPVGVWGNSYDAFYWQPADAQVAKLHSAFITRLKAYLKEDAPASWALQGYISMQFLVEGIRKANSIDSDKVSAALKGLEVVTPQGRMTMRAKDQQVTRGMLWGQASKSAQYAFPILNPIEYIDPAEFMD
jgi:branched-chain amino acid transport system substrate-binding protein